MNERYQSLIEQAKEKAGYAEKAQKKMNDISMKLREHTADLNATKAAIVTAAGKGEDTAGLADQILKLERMIDADRAAINAEAGEFRRYEKYQKILEAEKRRVDR
jgi:hypothetical protein